jgi:hypothetical protein
MTFTKVEPTGLVGVQLHSALFADIDNPRATGGFIRICGVPEMIRIRAPVYVKTGSSGPRSDTASQSPPGTEKRAVTSEASRAGSIKEPCESRRKTPRWSADAGD